MTTNIHQRFAQDQQKITSPLRSVDWLRQFETPLARSSISPAEWRALGEFLPELQTRYGDVVEDVILYGSAARGEERIESDVDLLLLLNRGLSQAEREMIYKLAWDAAGMHDCVLSPLFMSPDEQQWHRRGSSLWRNIQRDGIGLWKKASDVVQLDTNFEYRKSPASGDYVMTAAQYDEIRLYLENSAEDLAAADLLIRSGMERLAISHCYYAIFYAASALLLTKGMTRAKHSGVESALHQYFINTGILSDKLGEIYKNLHKERELTDYRASYIPTEGLPEQRLEQAQEFVEAVRNYLTQHGYLNEAQ
ncbi:MAG: HEPN domain-containing protein [Chloroflexi bacterium]|nr:HEPN domain-containing protein [Chloroflexota bacterium]